jgi:hypothetical protein
MAPSLKHKSIIANWKRNSPHNSAIHLATWRDGMPKRHAPQVFGLTWVLELKWMDFCSFDPRMPPELRLYVERVTRNEPYIADLESKVLTFLAEADAQAQDFSRMGLAA